MKKIYNLNEKELKKADSEFKSTAYGKRLFYSKTTVIITSIFVYFFYILSDIGESANIMETVKDGFFWLMILLSMFAEEFIRIKYNIALKEYIESKE